MNVDIAVKPDTPTQVAVAPLVLTPPEAALPVVAEQVQGSVKLPDALREQVDTQLDAFCAGLKGADLNSDEFKKRLDQAFNLGRKEIADATTLTNMFTKKNFVGETDEPAYKAISDMRTLFDDLNPAKQGDLFTQRRILGVIPFGNKLQTYLRRYESADSQMNKIYESVVLAKDEVAKGVSELGNMQQKMWTGLEKLEAAVYFITRLDERLTSEIEQVRAAEPDRARSLEQEVLYYVRQNQGDLLAMQAVTINAYTVAGIARKTGREVMNGCDRVSTLGMAALSVGVSLARATGVQIKTAQMLGGAKKSIEDLVLATGQAVQDHVKATAEFSSNPLLGVQTLQKMVDQTFSALDSMEQFRLASLTTMQSNNEMVRTDITKYMHRLKNDRSAEAGELKLEATGGISLAA
jgi:uncharacterized protein YaaN involved in tellurite resistance